MSIRHKKSLDDLSGDLKYLSEILCSFRGYHSPFPHGSCYGEGGHETIKQGKLIL